MSDGTGLVDQGAAAVGGWMVGGRTPEEVIAPASAEDAVEALARAAERGLGVVPLGAGTDRGCEPPRGRFVVLCTERLNTIERYEAADLTITAGSGVGVGDVARELDAHGQWLPFDPPYAFRRTLGGLVGSDARGTLTPLYGAVRDHVLGLTVVTGDGRVLHLGGRVMKNVAGFDLVRLMVGSRGTLGVIVSVSLRLFPKPAEDRVLVLRCDDASELAAAAKAVTLSTVVPASAMLTTEAGEGARLAVRLHGAPDAVDVEEARVLGALAGEAERLRGDEAAAFCRGVADHGAVGPGGVALRASCLVARVPDVLAAVAAALPGADIAADVLTGFVRAAVPASHAAEVEAGTVRALRARVEELGGALALDAAPPELASEVGAYGGGSGGGVGGRSADGLSASLKRHFDPGALLSPGRFVS